MSRAVVIGGGIAGLLCARVLSQSYGQVVMIERDRFARSNDPRSGVPQGRHVHALLMRGGAIIEELFPGITEDLAGRETSVVDPALQFRWFSHGAWLAARPSAMTMLFMSRPFLENAIFERLEPMSSVAFRPGCKVIGLSTNEAGRVTGARVTPVAGASGETEVLPADLIVDAGGRSGLVQRLLPEMGFSAPREEKIDVGLSYASRRFRLAKPLDPPCVFLIFDGKNNRRGAAMFPIENNEIIVTLIERHGAPVPRGEEEFAGFVDGLPVPQVKQILAQTEPVSAISVYRFPSSQRRRYEELSRFPSGLLAVGDSICSFNPVFGQGMTVAALEAMHLRRILAGGSRSRPDAISAPAFFRAVRPVIDQAWQAAAMEDLRFPETPGPRPLSLRFGQWYVKKVVRAAWRDAGVTEQYIRVASFLDPPGCLFRPSIFWRVIRA